MERFSLEESKMDLSLKTKVYKEMNLPKGQLIFSKGDPAKNIYILNRGRIVCFLLSKDKRVVPVHGLEDGGIFGEDGVLANQQVYQYYAVAIEDSAVTLIPKSDVNTFIKDSADWLKNILNTISERVHNTIELISEHKIIDDKLYGLGEFSQADEKLILKSLQESS